MLDKIVKEIEGCAECKKETSGKAVPGEGSPNAQVVFVGEAPGKTESLTGRPFVGRSGKLLRSLIHSIGLHDTDVFITSPVKYLPKGIPTAMQVRHGAKHLEKQLHVINPNLVVLLGSVAAQALLREHIPVVKEHGSVREKDGRKFVITLHPASAIRFQKNKPILVSDFEKIRRLL